MKTKEATGPINNDQNCCVALFKPQRMAQKTILGDKDGFTFTLSGFGKTLVKNCSARLNTKQWPVKKTQKLRVVTDWPRGLST